MLRLWILFWFWRCLLLNTGLLKLMIQLLILVTFFSLDALFTNKLPLAFRFISKWLTIFTLTEGIKLILWGYCLQAQYILSPLCLRDVYQLLIWQSRNVIWMVLRWWIRLYGECWHLWIIFIKFLTSWRWRFYVFRDNFNIIWSKLHFQSLYLLSAFSNFSIPFSRL